MDLESESWRKLNHVLKLVLCHTTYGLVSSNIYFQWFVHA
uniref:Uncharacterized protein n=1 Tax=Rhizophora mucronata TaxID=61149 RepID=A0A2P2N087_RHIMU